MEEDLKNEIKKVINEWLLNKQMQDVLKIYPELVQIVKNADNSSISISTIEQLEHIKNELENPKFGLPTIVDLLKYRPEKSEFQIPDVFYEHPETTKTRVLKTYIDGDKEKILDTEIIDVNQLKIHYIIGTLSKKVVNNEEHLTKILNGEINYDWNEKIKYVLLNEIDSDYPHIFEESIFNNEIHLYPKSITMRSLPYKKFNNTGIKFCPNCFNMLDEDELLENDIIAQSKKIEGEILNNNLNIDIRANYCPKCTQKIFESKNKKDKESILLFSYLYKNNYNPDVIPIIEKHSKIIYESNDVMKVEDKIIKDMLGETYLSNNNSISELISGYQRLYKIHFLDGYKPSKGIYEWQNRKLSKGDNNVYYYWKHLGKNIPAKICLEKENTDALIFKIPPLEDSILYDLPYSILLDVIFSSLNMLLSEKRVMSNIFSLNSISEFINSYIYLSIDTSKKYTLDQLIDELMSILKQLNDELYQIHIFCINNEIEFNNDLVPGLDQYKSMVPINEMELNDYVEYQNEYGNLNISNKMSLLLRLFDVGNPRGSLFISGEKKPLGLNIDVVIKEIIDEITTIDDFKDIINKYMQEIYIHTLSHVLYRSAIEISKCDDNDISYDYSLPNEISIYDNYSGGSGFINECCETFDNLIFSPRERPKFGFIQQIENNLNLCMNYLSNYMLYGISKQHDIKEIVDLTYNQSSELLNRLMDHYYIDDLTYNKIIVENYDKNVLPYIHSLIRQNLGIFYTLIYNSYKYDYDDLILLQNCPTISLFLLLCKLDNYSLTTLIRHIFKDDTIIIDNIDHDHILNIWEEIFTSDNGILFSKYYRNYLSVFEDMITTCIKGCYDCSYISFNCNYSPFEQPKRVNTFITRKIYNKLKDNVSLKFPLNNVDEEISILKYLDEIYFKFEFKDFKSINQLLNTILISLSNENYDRVEPTFTIDVINDNLNAYLKLRRKLS